MTRSEKEEVFKFLDRLRDSGITNMFGATPYITDLHPELSQSAARSLLMEWMETFDERHPRKD